MARFNIAHRAAEAVGDAPGIERLDREAAITFGDPASRLLVYGTLRPGEANHGLVADLGSWMPASVRGTLGEWHGYPMLVATGAGEPGADIPADLLTSPALVTRYADLDAFEGPAYRRELVVGETADGPVVASCYVRREATREG